MSKTRLLRLAIRASVALAVLFQTAFLFELHSVLPSDLALWSLSILTFACVAIVLLVRRSLATKAKVSYRAERVYLQRRFVGMEASSRDPRLESSQPGPEKQEQAGIAAGWKHIRLKAARIAYK